MRQQLTRRQKERLLRVYQILSDIPFPHDGSGSFTSSIAGLADFAADMRQVKPAIMEFLLGWCAEGREDEGDWSPPDTILDMLEEWVELRKVAQWGRPIPSFRELYQERQLTTKQENQEEEDLEAILSDQQPGPADDSAQWETVWNND